MECRPIAQLLCDAKRRTTDPNRNLTHQHGPNFLVSEQTDKARRFRARWDHADAASTPKGSCCPWRLMATALRLLGEVLWVGLLGKQNNANALYSAIFTKWEVDSTRYINLIYQNPLQKALQAVFTASTEALKSPEQWWAETILPHFTRLFSPR